MLRRRVRTVLRRLLVGSFVVVAVLVAAACVLVCNLDEPWCKREVQRLVRTSLGVDVDYRSISFHGFEAASVDDVVVRAAGNELLRARMVGLVWSIRALRVTDVRVTDATATIGVDENGGTTFDALAANTQPGARSVRLAGDLRAAARYPTVEADDLSVVVVWPRDRTSLDGLALRFAPGHLAVEGAALRAAHTGALGAFHGEGRLHVDASFSDDGAHGAVDVDVASQDVLAGIAAPRDLHAALDVRFDGDAIRLGVERARIGDGLATFSGAVRFADDRAVTVPVAEADVDLARTLALVPVAVPFSVGGGHARVRAEELRLDALDAASLSLDADVTSARGAWGEVTNVRATARVDRGLVAAEVRGEHAELRGLGRVDALSVSVAGRRVGPSLSGALAVTASAVGYEDAHARGVRLFVDVPHAGLDLSGEVSFAGTVDSVDARGVALSGLRLGGNVARRAESIDYRVDARAVPSGLPLATTGVTVRSTGRIGTDGRLDQHAVVEVERPSYGKLHADTARIGFRSTGTLRQQSVDGSIDIAGPSLTNTDEHIDLRTTVDLVARSAEFSATTRGSLIANLSGTVARDPAGGIALDAEANVESPASVVARVPALQGLEVGALRIGASGTLRDGAVDGHARVAVDGVAWNRGDLALRVPAFATEATVRTAFDARVVDVHLRGAELWLAKGARVATVGGLDEHTHLVVSGPLASPTIELDGALVLRAFAQNVVPGLPPGDVRVSTRARLDEDGVVHLHGLDVRSDAIGSTIGLAGALDPRHRRLSLHGRASGSLAFLPDVTGSAALALGIESADLSTFRIAADAQLHEVSSVRPGIRVEGANGELHVTTGIRIDRDGVALLHPADGNAFKAVRFPDQHPLYRDASYFSVRRIELPWTVLTEVAGNLEVEEDRIALHDVEARAASGRVRGEAALTVRGEDSTIALRLGAAGLVSPEGDRFTGNAALVVAPVKGTVDGRIDILEIGERHLRQLLDVQDPVHADADMNRIRSLLRFGHPKRARIELAGGFASLHLKLGGLARFVAIDDVRGVAIGPLVAMIPTRLP